MPTYRLDQTNKHITAVQCARNNTENRAQHTEGASNNEA